jgi:hypothetical protein
VEQSLLADADVAAAESMRDLEPLVVMVVARTDYIGVL